MVGTDDDRGRRSSTASVAGKTMLADDTGTGTIGHQPRADGRCSPELKPDNLPVYYIAVPR